MVDPAFLAEISLFAGLAPAERELLAGRIYERRYRKGTIIFGEGEAGEAAYFVREGRVKIYRLTPEGVEQILGVFAMAQPFGLVAALDGATFPATAEAADDSRIWVLRRDDLQQLMEVHPGLTSGILKEMGDRLRRAQGRVHSLAARSVRQRIAEYLLDQVTQQAPAGAMGGAHSTVTIRLTMTHQELGAFLGATRETVTRALADLRREEVITLGNDDALTVHPERLRIWLEP